MTATLTGVGVGPGEPDLLTIKGRDALLDADVLLVPVATTDHVGHAEAVVTAHVGHATPITRLVFSVAADTDTRDACWQRAAETVAAAVADGRNAALATIGDPNLYSTFSHLARQVRRRVPDVEIRTIPGITAMQDLAARSGTVLAERDEHLALLPLTAGTDRVRRTLDETDTVVLYKGGRHLPDIRSIVAASGRAGNAVFGARMGLDGQDIRRELPEGRAPYLSTVIVTRPRP